MKKIAIASLIIALTALLSLALFSCGEEEPSVGGAQISTSVSGEDSSGLGGEHYHIYDMQTWVTTANGHYNPCTCHPNAITVKAHVDNLDWNGICDVCQYVLKKSDVYTLTLVDEEGLPVEGAVVILRSNSDVTLTTDAKGQVSAEFTDVGGVNAVIDSLPSGYTVGADNKRAFRFAGYELTVTVYKTQE